MQFQTIEHLIDEAYTHWNNAERVGEIGIELESRTRLNIARKFLKRAIYLNPTGNPEWYSFLAFACFRDVTRMDEAGETALTEGIEQTNSELLKATYIAFLEDEQAAEELIQQAGMSKDPSVRLALGFALNWRGRTEESLNIFQDVVANLAEGELPSGLEDYAFTMAWAKAQGHDIDVEKTAVPVINRLITSDPYRYRYHAIKVQVYQVLKQWDQVVETCQTILKLMPDEETTMLALGIALEKLNRTDEALLWYSRAIGAKPSFARARLNIAKICEDRKEFELAESYLREIPVAFPEYTFGGIFLSFFLYRQKRTDESKHSFSDSYARLKTHEKSLVERYPEGKELLELTGL